MSALFSITSLLLKGLVLLNSHFGFSVLPFDRLAHHQEAIQFRRMQIRGSDSSEDEEEEEDDIEWGPATEL